MHGAISLCRVRTGSGAAGSPAAKVEEENDQASGGQHASVLAVALICCTILYGLYRAALVLTTYEGHDQAWYLIAAERVLGGAQLYGPYVSDSNPPMVVWFSMLPVLLSHGFHLPLLVWLRVIVLCVLVASTAWCVRMLRWTPHAQHGLTRALVWFAILYPLLRVTLRDFGQREHLFVILALPYLFAVGTGAMDRLTLTERCALGFAAGIAVCFKPPHALALVGAEIVIALTRRSLRRIISPEVLMMVGTCAAYLLAVRVITPAYTKQMLPVLLDTYWAYGTFTALGLLSGVKFRLLAALLLLILSLTLRRRRPLSQLVAVLAAASVGAFLAYVQQGTDWSYHRLPSSVFLIMAALLALLDVALGFVVPWDRYRMDRRKATVCCAVAAVAGVAFFPIDASRPKLQDSEVYKFLAAQDKPGTVLVLSTTVWYIGDVLDLHWHWGGSYPCLPFLPAIVVNEQGLQHEKRAFKQLSPQRLASISRLQRKVIAEDLNHFKPSLVMVEHCDEKHDCSFLEGRTFNSLAWFLQDAEFAQAWSQYHKQANAVPSFDIYRRTP